MKNVTSSDLDLGETDELVEENFALKTDIIDIEKKQNKADKKSEEKEGIPSDEVKILDKDKNT